MQEQDDMQQVAANALARLQAHTLEASDRAVADALRDWEWVERAVSWFAAAFAGFLLGIGWLLFKLPVFLGVTEELHAAGLQLLGALSTVLSALVVARLLHQLVTLSGRRTERVAALSAVDSANAQNAFYLEHVMDTPELARIAAQWRKSGIPLRDHEKGLLRQAQASLEGRAVGARLSAAGLHVQETRQTAVEI